ncbi:hypothetical protein ACTXT7_006626 [Hymenolepis weldensis]
MLWDRTTAVSEFVGANALFERYQPLIAAIEQTVSSLWSFLDGSKGCLLTYFIENKEYDMSEADASQLPLKVIAGGVDTTTLSMVWCCYALANGKLDLEPREVFTESKLEEIHRLASVIPMAFPHFARSHPQG